MNTTDKQLEEATAEWVETAEQLLEHLRQGGPWTSLTAALFKAAYVDAQWVIELRRDGGRP